MTEAAPKFETILVEFPAEHVTRIVLNRERQRNAQHTQLLYELNLAFNEAARDDNIKFVILAGVGDHFSAGHDLHQPPTPENMAPYEPVETWRGFACCEQTK